MNEPSVSAAGKSYELRFLALFVTRRGYAFPCDAQGHVDMDRLTSCGRTNYLFARAVVGTELAAPVVALLP
jgi:hypothetical protein